MIRGQSRISSPALQAPLRSPKMSHRRMQLLLTPPFGWLSELTSFPVRVVRPSHLSWRPSRHSDSRCFPSGWALLGSGLALPFLAVAARGIGAPLACVFLGGLGMHPDGTPPPPLPPPWSWLVWGEKKKKSIWVHGCVLSHVPLRPPVGPGQAVCSVETGAGGDTRRNQGFRGGSAQG